MKLADNRKATLQAIHTDTVNKSVKDQKKDIVLDATWCQASLRLPSSSDDIDTISPMEQTNGLHPGI